MLFPRPSAMPCVRRVSVFSALVIAGALAAAAQSAPPPAPDASSSSSDVQTAKVLDKTKDTFKRDVAISLFGQDSDSTNGNFIRIDPTASGGLMASYRQSPRWWFGGEANYGFTRYTDSYYKGVYKVKHDANEVTLAYLVDRDVYKGLHAFGSIGAGAMLFTPTQYGGSVQLGIGTLSTQTLPLFVYSLGVQKLITSRFGVRVQFREDKYKDPNFKQDVLNTHVLRTTPESAIGVYYRF